MLLSTACCNSSVYVVLCVMKAHCTSTGTSKSNRQREIFFSPLKNEKRGIFIRLFLLSSSSSIKPVSEITHYFHAQQKILRYLHRFTKSTNHRHFDDLFFFCVFHITPVVRTLSIYPFPSPIIFILNIG